MSQRRENTFLLAGRLQRLLKKTKHLEGCRKICHISTGRYWKVAERKNKQAFGHTRACLNNIGDQIAFSSRIVTLLMLSNCNLYFM